MFKIGDFSKISRVSVKTLHHYDEIGLLNPLYVDPFTGYRYYSTDQLMRLTRILALKELGFSLEQIGQLLDGGLDHQELRGMFKLRQAELMQDAESIRTRLANLEIRLNQIEGKDSMNYEVVLKRVAPMTVISTREIVPSSDMMRERCNALLDEVGHALALLNVQTDGLCLALYYDNTAQGIDVEMALQTTEHAPAALGRVKVYQLPAVETMASVLYRGSYDAFDAVGQVYATLGKWIEQNGYRIIGPSREIYVQTPTPNASGIPEGVMEIQFPVEKA
ncbi:MAG: MerR family transcriptional regulator [Anaerolineae bacterium]|nr:MerR family transcriptional regulator [Anaerolineae bacterium]